MFSFRGDAHKLYLQLKKAIEQKTAFTQMKELMEIQEIQKFYQSIDRASLKHIYYRLLKEKNGSGVILALISALPWLLLLFSTQLQKFLFSKGALLWAAFTIIYLVVLIISVIVHFREKAWCYVHVEIIKDILEEG